MWYWHTSSNSAWCSKAVLVTKDQRTTFLPAHLPWSYFAEMPCAGCLGPRSYPKIASITLLLVWDAQQQYQSCYGCQMSALHQATAGRSLARQLPRKRLQHLPAATHSFLSYGSHQVWRRVTLFQLTAAESLVQVVKRMRTLKTCKFWIVWQPPVKAEEVSGRLLRTRWNRWDSGYIVIQSYVTAKLHSVNWLVSTYTSRQCRVLCK